MDYGHEQTDKDLKRLEKRIQKEYRQAAKEAEAELDLYLKKFKAKDEKMLERLKANEITEKEYLKWRTSEVAVGERWQAVREDLVSTYQNANKVASSMIQDNAYKAYADNFNFGTFEVEKGSGVNTAFTLYSKDAVKKLVKDDPTLLPSPGAKVSKAIREGKAKRWNRQQVQSVMVQGLLQGESIGKISKRLAQAVGETNMHSAIRSARTMTTEAENAGRIDSYKRAESMGIEVKKQWLATLDGRTRHSHRVLDGESVGLEEKFSNGLMFPADPDGSPSEVYNCRCTLVADIPKFTFGVGDLSQRRMGKGFMGDYEEWKAEHKKAEKLGIVNGTDISGTWTRRADRFDFEIEDVINAQGFDGLPRVVDEEEFDRAVKESEMYCCRVYGAETEEILKGYQTQLYNGKWYVDCSTGGAAFGQGMYCACSYTNIETKAVAVAMVNYAESTNNIVETLTITKDARTITNDELSVMFRSESDDIREKFRDRGAYAASKGYDAITHCGRREYVVVLNRTKCIFKKGAEIQDYESISNHRYLF